MKTALKKAVVKSGVLNKVADVLSPSKGKAGKRTYFFGDGKADGTKETRALEIILTSSTNM